MVSTGFERYKGGSALSQFACLGDCLSLGMRTPAWCGYSSPDDYITPDEQCADGWVGAGAAKVHPRMANGGGHEAEVL